MITFSHHAKIRMKQRGISTSFISRTISNPDKIERSHINQYRFLVKKIYYNALFKKDHLLLIICEKEKSATIKVVTIIDTSKISKHF